MKEQIERILVKTIIILPILSAIILLIIFSIYYAPLLYLFAIIPIILSGIAAITYIWSD